MNMNQYSKEVQKLKNLDKSSFDTILTVKRFEHEGGAGYKAEFETTDSRILAATLTTIVSGIANILGTSSLDVVQMLAKVTLQEQESLRNAYHKVIDDVVSTNLN